ncbi:MAG: malate synthase A [Deinococcota bacterium]
MPQGVEILGEIQPGFEEILTEDALEFVASLQRKFNATRKDLLAKRATRQAEFDAGNTPDFLAETASIRSGDWQVAPTPDDLQDRRVEITGPTERKMMINALNSGAKVFMADCEDALSPTWFNVVQGQINLRDAVREEIRFVDDAKGKTYELGDELATLLVRPRGWHLVEKHILVDGEPLSASLFDFGMYMFHNAAERLARGTGPYFYLPKLESHLEARLWNDVFVFSQDALGIPQGSVRVTVLIETILASFEMEEILYELRDHAAGLNAGRWDYIFSAIKKFSKTSAPLPDRGQITMTVPFMRAYSELLVRTCHKRGAHAIGGMSAFIPNRRDPEVTENALANVKADKEREAKDGYDGSWVAHPDLVATVKEVFNAQLGDKPNQKDRLREDVAVTARDLINTDIAGGSITEDGLRLNISVGIQYVNAWLMGNGAAAINNLMEDAATAEISRAQLWQWLHGQAKLDDGRTVTSELYEQIKQEELEKLGGIDKMHYQDATEAMDKLIRADAFTEFLTIPAYDYLS